MDSVDALERGLLPTPMVAPLAEDVPLPSEVARRWAVALGLRTGGVDGPHPTALEPVLARWARERGWTAPHRRELGTGLAWAGLRRRRRAHGEGGLRLLLHRDDAALLWRLVREAWAPGYAPGDSRGKHRRKRRARKYPRRTAQRPPPTPFHEELARLGRGAAPVVDTLGRVWPSPCVAARHLGGNLKALDNSRRALHHALATPPVDSSALRSALRKGAPWKGVLWRHLTPAEVAAVPPGHLAGEPLPGYAWGLTCHRCGGCAPHSR